MSQRQPNVLFLICDDLNNALAGLGRMPSAPAPNVQRLMREGVSFPNAHSNCPICLPARNSLFSGLYAHTTGHFTLWDNWRTVTPIATTMPHGSHHGKALLGSAVMMPKHFKEHGYGVFGAGKVLHEGAVDPSWWTEYSGGPDYGPAFWDGTLTPQQVLMYEGDPLATYARRYAGIDRFWLNGDTFRFNLETASGTLQEIFGGRSGQAYGANNTPFRYENDDDRDPLPDEKTAAWGVDVLRRRHDRPFFLGLGFMKPHTPLNAPSRFFEMFPPDQLPLPPQLPGDLDDCARALIEHRPYGFLLYQMVTKLGEGAWRRWLQSYLASVAFVDEQIGRVLTALDNSPYCDNTIVVFTSDNGYHMGEKEYLFKDSLWEESTQIPLVIRAPGGARAGATCGLSVSHIDLYPTLLDLCGLPAQPHAATNGQSLDGSSLRRLLADPGCVQWGGPPVALSSVRGNTGIHHSVRSATHRYTLCQNGEEELYDHRTDPHEWHNLAGQPAHAAVACELRKQMMKLLWP